MSDDVRLNVGTGGDLIAADDIGGVKYPRMKLVHGPDGTNAGDVSTANGLPVQPLASTYNSAITVTRPANTTAYTANDVVGGAIAFTSAGPTAGNVVITSVDLRYDVNAVPSGMTTFRLYLYSVTPPSALADNSAWDLPSGDRASFLGYVDIGTVNDLGSTLFAQVDAVNRQVKLGTSETALYGYLVTAGAYTPSSNSETLQVTLKTVAL